MACLGGSRKADAGDLRIGVRLWRGWRAGHHKDLAGFLRGGSMDWVESLTGTIHLCLRRPDPADLPERPA